VIPPSEFDRWRQVIIQLFEIRNEAVHHNARPRDPSPHPAFSSGVPRPANVFRFENTANVVALGLETAKIIVAEPRPTRGKGLRDGVSAWPGFADELFEYARQLNIEVTVNPDHATETP
jgi:hypothetical protein